MSARDRGGYGTDEGYWDDENETESDPSDAPSASGDGWEMDPSDDDAGVDPTDPSDAPSASGDGWEMDPSDIFTDNDDTSNGVDMALPDFLSPEEINEQINESVEQVEENFQSGITQAQENFNSEINELTESLAGYQDGVQDRLSAVTEGLTSLPGQIARVVSGGSDEQKDDKSDGMSGIVTPVNVAIAAVGAIVAYLASEEV